MLRGQGGRRVWRAEACSPLSFLLLSWNLHFKGQGKGYQGPSILTIAHPRQILSFLSIQAAGGRMRKAEALLLLH